MHAGEHRQVGEELAQVDREERPDVDKIYMTFIQAMTGQGGWPLYFAPLGFVNNREFGKCFLLGVLLYGEPRRPQGTSLTQEVPALIQFDLD